MDTTITLMRKVCLTRQKQHSQQETTLNIFASLQHSLVVWILYKKIKLLWEVLLYRDSGTNNPETRIPCKNSLK